MALPPGRNPYMGRRLGQTKIPADVQWEVRDIRRPKPSRKRTATYG